MKVFCPCSSGLSASRQSNIYGISRRTRRVTPGLGALLIPKFDVILTHQGKSIKTTAGFDSGNESIAIIYPSVAQQLGLPLLRTIQIVGVGSKQGYTSRIDQIRLADSPTCFTNNADVTILDIGDPRFEVLIGDPFLKAIGADIQFRETGSALICKGAKQVEIAQPAGLSPLTISLIAGGVLAVGALVILGTKSG